jgi:hypothetical protein
MDITILKQERGPHQKRPWRPSRFTRISSIVMAYKLGEGFLQALDSRPESWVGDRLWFKPGKGKAPLEMPLFALATAEDYHLTTTIIRKINNPYLDYVQDPEEILFCRPLFLRNPHLGPDELARFHFSTLLGLELAPVAPTQAGPKD